MSEREQPNRLKRFQSSVKAWAKHYKIELTAVFYAMKHPSTPWYAKMMAAVVVGYAFSPIDLIPDFIPVLGYLDDALLLPLGIALTLKLIPSHIMAECREKARNQPPEKGSHKLAAGIIIGIWLVILFWIGNVFLFKQL